MHRLRQNWGGGHRHADIYSKKFEFSTCRECQKCQKIAYFRGNKYILKGSEAS